MSPQPQWQNGDAFKLAVWGAADCPAPNPVYAGAFEENRARVGLPEGFGDLLGATQERLAGMADDLSGCVRKQEAQTLWTVRCAKSSGEPAGLYAR